MAENNAREARSSRITEVVFWLLILLIPTQLGKHWWPQWSLVNGVRVDYLAPTLYATDVLLAALGVVLMIGHVIPLSGKRGCEKKLLSVKVISFLGIWGMWAIWVVWAILRTERPMLAAYWIARYLEIGVMAIATHRVIRGIRGVQGAETIRKALAIGVIFLVGLEIAQTFLGRTTGWFWILGERNFNISTPGIATIAIRGREMLRPYATFSHPNALAGYLAVAGALVGLRGRRGVKGIRESRVIRGISFLGVALTGSRVAIMAAALGWLGFWGIRGFGGAERANGLILFAPRAVEERVVLNKAGWEMFKNNWLWGVGPGQFLVQLPNYLPTYERSLQPAHNVFLLLLNEFGAAGGGIIVINVIKVIKIISRNRENKEMAVLGTVILITAFFDHYWATSQQNRLLLGLVMGLSMGNKSLKPPK